MNNERAEAIAPLRIDGLRRLAPRYDALLCDVWGVVHDGRRAFPESCAALRRFREGGGVVVLVTNSPRPRGAVMAQLDRLGAPADSYDDVVTSGDVTLAYMAARGDAPVHHIGPSRDLALFDALHAETGRAPRFAPLAEAAYVVCTGLVDDEHEEPEDYRDVLDAMRARDLDFICANPDLVVHVGSKLVYCAGALAALYVERGGRALQAGKPHAPIYQRALGLVAELRGADAARVLAIGDAMRTDIRGACDAGLDSLFVTAGIHREALHPDGDLRLDAAALAQFLGGEACRPTAAIARLVW